MVISKNSEYVLLCLHQGWEEHSSSHPLSSSLLTQSLWQEGWDFFKNDLVGIHFETWDGSVLSKIRLLLHNGDSMEWMLGWGLAVLWKAKYICLIFERVKRAKPSEENILESKSCKYPNLLDFLGLYKVEPCHGYDILDMKMQGVIKTIANLLNQVRDRSCPHFPLANCSQGK